MFRLLWIMKTNIKRSLYGAGIYPLRVTNLWSVERGYLKQKKAKEFFDVIEVV